MFVFEAIMSSPGCVILSSMRHEAASRESERPSLASSTGYTSKAKPNSYNRMFPPLSRHVFALPPTSYSLSRHRLAPPTTASLNTAQVHLRMGSTRRARILLQACLGQLLANAPVQSQGEAWLAMARCDIAEVSLSGVGQSPPSSTAEPRTSGDGGVTIEGGGGRRGTGDGPAAPAVPGSARRGETLRRAVANLDRAITKLKRCHDFAGLRECLYLKVTCFGWAWADDRQW